MTDKQQVKNQVNNAMNELIDSLATEGSLDYFDIKIKHSNGEIYAEKTSKHKFKVEKVI